MVIGRKQIDPGLAARASESHPPAIPVVPREFRHSRRLFRE
jgi:hypothetical protein